MRRLAASFEGLNSFLAQLSVEIFPRKNMWKLLEFSLSLPPPGSQCVKGKTKLAPKLFRENASPHTF